MPIDYLAYTQNGGFNPLTASFSHFKDDVEENDYVELLGFDSTTGLCAGDNYSFCRYSAKRVGTYSHLFILVDPEGNCYSVVVTPTPGDAMALHLMLLNSLGSRHL